MLVADRRAATRAAVARALELAGFTVCAACGDTPSAVAEAVRLRPDVCLVDVDLPGGGLTAVRAIVAHLESTRVLVLASPARPDDVLAALRAGAAGYVLKDVDPQRLPADVRAVLDGEAVLPPESVARLVAEFRALDRAVGGTRRAGRTPDARRSNR